MPLKSLSQIHEAVENVRTAADALSRAIADPHLRALLNNYLQAQAARDALQDEHTAIVRGGLSSLREGLTVLIPDTVRDALAGPEFRISGLADMVETQSALIVGQSAIRERLDRIEQRIEERLASNTSMITDVFELMRELKQSFEKTE